MQLKKTVEDASALTPTVQWYVPQDWKVSDVLGTNELGTGAIQYVPKYKDKKGDTVKAYSIYSENKQLSEKTW